MNFRYEVQTKGDPKWYGNGLVFSTRADAEAAALAKWASWTAVEHFRVVEDERPYNALWNPDLYHVVLLPPEHSA